jgi:hypothetical protein
MKVIVYTGRIQDDWTNLMDTTFKFAEREPQGMGAILAPPKYLVFGHKAWRGDKRFGPSALRRIRHSIGRYCSSGSMPSQSSFGSCWWALRPMMKSAVSCLLVIVRVMPNIVIVFIWQSMFSKAALPISALTMNMLENG